MDIVLEHLGETRLPVVLKSWGTSMPSIVSGSLEILLIITEEY